MVLWDNFSGNLCIIIVQRAESTTSLNGTAHYEKGPAFENYPVRVWGLSFKHSGVLVFRV